MKRTRIEVISVRYRVVSIIGSDGQAGRTDTDIGVLLSAVGDIVLPAEEMSHEINEGSVEIIRRHFQPLRLMLSRMQGVLLTQVQNKKE